MSLLNSIPKELIIEIIKKAKKNYYKLSCGNSIYHVCGNIKMMYEKIRNSSDIQKEIVNHWLYSFDKNMTEDISNLKNKLVDFRTERKYVYNTVIEILEKYPIPSAKIEKLTFYGDISFTSLNKMSKRKLNIFIEFRR